MSGDKNICQLGNGHVVYTLGTSDNADVEIKKFIKFNIDYEWKKKGVIALPGVFRPNKYPAGACGDDYDAEVVSEMFKFSEQQQKLGNGDKLASAIATHVEKNKAIKAVKKIDLSNNGITDTGAIALVRVLTGDPFCTLDIRNNNISGGVKAQLIKECGNRIMI